MFFSLSHFTHYSLKLRFSSSPLFLLFSLLKLLLLHHQYSHFFEGIESYKRLSAAGDLKASQKLAALTGVGDLAAKGERRVGAVCCL